MKFWLALVLLASCCCSASAQPPVSRRPVPRPAATPEQRAEAVNRLRAAYAKPPGEWPAPQVDEGVEHRELGPIPPLDPALTPQPAQVELGKKLFFDPRLSGSGQIACASCHDPDLGWADGRATSFGHDRTKLTRNAPSIFNAGLRESLFWDGRAANLEAQATAVVNNPDEMHASGAVVVEHLEQIPEYVAEFDAVFGPQGLTLENAVAAISAFELTVVGGKSRFDAFLAGRSAALNDEALLGLHLFRTEARCINCHNGPLLSDDKFHNIGLSNYGRRFEDLGRYKVTGAPEDVGRFRTPSLRHVAATAPYMHSGLFDIDEVLRLYNSGMPEFKPRANQQDDPLFPVKSPLLKPLGLNQRDLDDLKAFLTALTEPHRRVDPPELPGL